MFFKAQMKERQEVELSVQEAHVLWRLATDRHIIIGHLNQLINFTHDKDFLAYLKKLSHDYKDDVKMLEAQLQKFSIPGPTPSVKSQNVQGNSEVLSDRETAEVLFGFMRLDIGLKLSSLKDITTNDDVRALIIKLIRISMKRIDTLIKILKMKNWIAYPPLYPYTDPNAEEKVAANEIYLIWDHLVFRYNNIRQTQTIISFAADPDFKLLLEFGLRILQKQTKTLENKLLYYGVVLPKPYTSVTPTPDNKELLEDKYMFNTILRGIQNATALHGFALQEIIVNDEIRKFFRSLTLKEISYADKMLKYGKIKGWTFTPPTYKGGM